MLRSLRVRNICAYSTSLLHCCRYRYRALGTLGERRGALVCTVHPLVTCYPRQEAQYLSLSGPVAWSWVAIYNPRFVSGMVGVAEGRREGILELI